MASSHTTDAYGAMPAAEGHYAAAAAVPVAAPVSDAPVSVFHESAGPTFDDSAPRDRGFAIAFWVHLLAFFVLLFAAGIPGIKNASNNSTNNSGTAGAPATATTTTLTLDVGKIVGLIFAMTAIAAGASAVMLWLCVTYPTALITFVFVVSTALLGISAIVFFAAGQVALGVILLLVFGLQLFFWRAIKARIPFASAILKTSCLAVKTHKNVIFVAFGAVIPSVIWFIVWVVCAVGIFQSLGSNGGAGFVCFILLISYYWTGAVIQNVVHATTCGVVGSYWYTVSPVNPTLGALKRSLTTSFGSICFGSLIIAFIKAVRTMINMARRKTNNLAASVILCILSCIITWIEDIARYYNSYAFVHCALYGKDFRTAGRHAYETFQQRGWTQIIGDSLIENTLSMLCFAMALVVCALGVAIGVSMGSGYGVLGGIAGFLIGLGCCLVVTSVVDSATHTIFVCWAEHPSALLHTHQEQFTSLATAWQQFQPEAWAASGYGAQFATTAV